MGGDDAPHMVIEGVRLALIRHPGTRFLLFGDEALIAPLVQAHPDVAAACEIRHCSDVVGMDAKPSQALRQGKESSMALALKAVKDGEAQAAISAGNTGALMALAKFTLRMFPGIERPAIAAIWPTMKGESIVLDVGANVDVSAKMLMDFAIMGEAFCRAVLGIDRPKVGVLNVGAEELKGTAAVREADEGLRGAPLDLDYIGFVEGNDISQGHADVVVTDGFNGNIALKTAEGTARLIAHYLNSAFRRSFFAKLGALFAYGAFRMLRARIDPRSVNGGTFLGLNGVVVKSHGGTDGTGYASALDLAIDMAESNFAQEIAAAVEKLKTAVSDTAPQNAAPATAEKAVS